MMSGNIWTLADGIFLRILRNKVNLRDAPQTEDWHSKSLITELIFPSVIVSLSFEKITDSFIVHFCLTTSGMPGKH